MGIYLGSSQARMSQQFFHRIDIGTVVHQVGGKGMTQGMRALLLYRGDEVKMLFYHAINIPGLHFSPFSCNEKKISGLCSEQVFLLLSKFFNRISQFAVDRDDALLIPFAQYFYLRI